MKFDALTQNADPQAQAHVIARTRVELNALYVLFHWENKMMGLLLCLLSLENKEQRHKGGCMGQFHSVYSSLTYWDRCP